MIGIRRLTAIFLCASLIAYASSQGNSFDRIRYNGGTVANSVDAKDWGNHLTVSSDLILFTFKNGQKAEINPKAVTSLSYGQEAHRRVGTMIALAILVAPVALFGLFHKTRLHFIGIQYRTQDGKTAGLLLQGDKDNYRAILVALQSVTGVPVSVAESEREFIPVGVTASAVKDSVPSQTADASLPAVPDSATGTVNIVSIPDGGDVYVDDVFMGDSPATLKLKPGRHIIRIKMSEYRDWEREMVVSEGSVNLNAKLIADSSGPVAESPASATAKSQKTSTPVYSVPQPNTVASSLNGNSGWIGVTTKDDPTRGVVITRVLPDSAASQAGLQVEDVIVGLNGTLVKSGMEFDIAVAHSIPGSQIGISYIRGISRSETKVTVRKIG